MTIPQSDTPRTDALDFGLRAACQPSSMYDMMTNHALTLERELNAALARVRELEAAQPPAPQYLDRPDKPGWWWEWEDYGGIGWVASLVEKTSTGLVCIEDNGTFSDPVAGIWLPATPPPPPSKE